MIPVLKVKATMYQESRLAGFKEITSLDMAVDPFKVINWEAAAHTMLLMWWNRDPEAVEGVKYLLILEVGGLNTAKACGKVKVVDGYLEVAWS